MNVPNSYFNLRWFKIYALVVSSYLLTMWLSQSLVNEIVYYNTYSEQLTYDRAMELYGNLKKYSWVGFAGIPVILLIKITAISLVLYIGVIFFNLQKHVSLGMVFRVVTGAEIVFIIAGVFKILWFYFFAGNYTLNDINFFYPASLINLFRTGEVDTLWIMPLQTVNLFHLLYLLLLAYGIRSVSKVDKAFCEKIVAGTYVPALMIWVAFIMFMSVNNNL